ncbi:MAG: hypothetical protein J0L84_01400 [Verrucomicrobia bacterium]|nr:hypothetical protein [Verrucomicrobiota bacterium]
MALFPPPSLPRSLLDPVDTRPVVSASFPLEQAVLQVVIVSPPPPRIVSEPAVSLSPQAGFRPEYLIDTRHPLEVDMDEAAGSD